MVVADGEVEDENEEISLTEAQKIEEDFEIGEDVSEEVKLIDLGRRSILALRQTLFRRSTSTIIRTSTNSSKSLRERYIHRRSTPHSS